jgi:aminopeptidase N
MKRQILISLLLTTCSFILMAQHQAEPKGSLSCSIKKSQSRIPSKGNFNPGEVLPHSYDVLNYKLDLNIFNCFITPFPKSFTGDNVITFRVDSALNAITLNAVNSSLLINSVGLSGTSFTHAGNILTIQLDRTYSPGEIVDVKVSYQHKNVSDNAFYVQDGMVFTDCEPEGARMWFPCWDKPSDKATVDATVKVPSNVKIGSNGRLADSVQNGDTLTYHWISAHNVATYLVVLSGKVGYNLDIVYWPKISDPNDSVPIRFYYNSGEDPGYIEGLIGEMTTCFSETYCEHPFEKNGFATLNGLFSWGGMENQTLTSLCPNCWQESLISHEYAHQWFGDMITCATWADIWLNEGFATFSEAVWLEHTGGYSAYKSDILNDANYYLGSNPGWPISDPLWAEETPNSYILFNYAVTYCKGACVLHELRYVLGDSLFFKTLKSYANDTNFRFKSATISDFVSVVNNVTSGDYNWFFDQWIYEPNHPVYQNTYNFQDLGNGEWRVNYFMTQIQSDPAFFKMPVEVNIRFADNSDTLISFMNDNNYQQFSWTFGKQPVFFKFDPDNQIVMKEGSTTVGTGEDRYPGSDVHLAQNTPNPASGATWIVFEVGKPMHARLEILDMVGNTIMVLKEGTFEAGKYKTEVDCTLLSPGVYLYRLIAGNTIQTKKLVIAK